MTVEFQYNFAVTPKSMKEALSMAQTAIGVTFNEPMHSIRTLQIMIDEIDRMRPVGLDGKHGDRHTPNCGCEIDPEANSFAFVAEVPPLGTFGIPQDWENRDPATGRHLRNGHVLVLSEDDWRCEICGHHFDAAVDADLFKCGEPCAGKHPGD